ncbi:nitroreductase family protein [Nocardia terpenica]|uniref:nitroreductase family protein n=1 Tax=Nocardia terpenica TaxID=455432 RepID=UPI001EEBCD81|nr:nitroreductase family protein [Nocardia terpenica]
MTDLDLLTTTRAFRRRLDPSAPICYRDIQACLDIAVHAPSGSNRQPWHFVLIDDPHTRHTIAHYYRQGFTANLTGRTPTPTNSPTSPPPATSPTTSTPSPYSSSSAPTAAHRTPPTTSPASTPPSTPPSGTSN